MKISNLTEAGGTPSSDTTNQGGGQAPKFGRSDKFLETSSGGTSASAVGTVAQPVPGTRRRGKGSMFQGISTSEKFANSRKAGIKEDTVTEDELSEEQLQAKQRREEIFNRAKDRELGNKPQSRDIIAKEATGRGTWDPNASDYEGDYGGSRNWERREREDDEHHHIDRAREKRDQSGTWYVTINGKVVKDKMGQPYTFYGKAAANKAALTMQAKPFNSGKQFMLTTNPNPPEQGVAEGSEQAWEVSFSDGEDVIKVHASSKQEAISKATQIAKSQGNPYPSVDWARSKEQGVAEANDYFRRREREEGRIAGTIPAKKAVVKTNKPIGFRISDIGPGGKEHNVKTDAAWDAAKKKVSEGSMK